MHTIFCRLAVSHVSYGERNLSTRVLTETAAPYPDATVAVTISSQLPQNDKVPIKLHRHGWPTYSQNHRVTFSPPGVVYSRTPDDIVTLTFQYDSPDGQV